jgi:peptidoglycan hydrolase-like protein with peptidoglycan-binding domain
VRTPLSRRASVLLSLALLGSAAVPSAAQAKLGDRAPLKTGMRGQDVRVLQDYLSKAGYDTDVDGQFGRGTRESVKAFEAAASLQPNGVMSAADIAALRRSVEAGGVGLRSASVTAPTGTATIGPDGKAVAPADAPPQVQQIIAAANEIEGKPYKYGGGHGDFDDTGYDCSGSVSYALHGAGLLDDAMLSSAFTSWGEPGPGTWVTIYANGGHMYMVVAGLRFDTSARRSVGGRWTTESRPAGGYTVRHPEGL